MQNFKSISTRKVNQARVASGIPMWQRNYYERIIRDEAALNRVRQYVADNPRRWAEDENNPARLR
jgi:putative transposase